MAGRMPDWEYRKHRDERNAQMLAEYRAWNLTHAPAKKEPIVDARTPAERLREESDRLHYDDCDIMGWDGGLTWDCNCKAQADILAVLGSGKETPVSTL